MSAIGHLPVLLDETLAALEPAAGRLYVDATLGLGGHSLALLERGARVLGFDRDGEAIGRARARLAAYCADGRLRTAQADYRDLLAVLAAEGTGPLDGLVADLGVSSYQIGDPERGFSFVVDGPLDMRMDRSTGPTAAELVNRLPEAELARLIATLGEEPAHRRVARAIARRRETAPFTRTADLAEVVARAASRPGPPPRIHPATRTFQALRVAVNDEHRGLGQFVEDAVAALRRGGRLAIISFHSLEDRPVKQALRALERGCTCPPELPFCACGKQPRVRLLSRRAIRPGEAEIERNPRARSARLRTAEKLDDRLAPGLERPAA